MTHYDPNDWEDDEPTKPPHWIIVVLVVSMLGIFSICAWKIANARELLITNEAGEIIARCEYPVYFRNVEGGIECRVPRLIYKNGFEG